MIGSFRSKALRNLWEKNDPTGVSPNARPRIARILSILESAESLRDLDVPGFCFSCADWLHASALLDARVTGNWRITFAWENGVASAVDLEDYHGS